MRTLLKIAIAGAMAIALAGFKARFVNPYRPKLIKLSIPAPAGHERLAGLRIAFVTDTHLGPAMHARDLRRLATLAASTAPDLILFGGDLVSESARHIEPALEALLVPLHALAPLGVVSVPGNHDLSVSTPKLERAYAGASIPLLRNRAIPLAWNGDELWIVGIDDTLLGDPNPEAAFAHVPPNAAALALWHEADFAEAAAQRGAFLQLSGHSHGGQVRIPGINVSWLPVHGRRFVSGRSEVGAMTVYVSNGGGVFRPPVRFLRPAEVTLITIVTSTTTSA